MSAVGFDIGNENCYVAVARAGGIEVIDNEYSLRATPSYLGFTEKSRDAGVSARTKLVPNIRNTVFGFKTLLGKTYSGSIRESAYLPYDICELRSDGLGIKVKYLNEEAVFSPLQIMAMLLTKLKAITETKLGIKVRECVISVPVFFTDIQRRAMLDAAEIADLKPLKLMNESTAIALAYGFYKHHHFNDPKTIVFVDLGQSSLTVSACLFSKEKLTVLGSVWNKSTGGRDFDCVLVKYFVEEFRNRYQLDVMSNKKALMLLLVECEALKKQMSMYTRELELSIECFMNDIDVRGKMKRDLFESLASQLLLKIEETMRDLLTQTGLTPEDIYEVQIVGGSCRLPALKSIIHKVFGQEPLSTLNQDEAVARGCALQCAFLSPTLKTKDFFIEDIQPYSIKVLYRESNREDELEVFPRFHKMPSCKLVTYAFNSPFFLDVFYAEPSISARSIGRFHFSDYPPDAFHLETNDVQVEVKISLDKNGLFNVVSTTLVIKQKDLKNDDASNLVIALPPLPSNENKTLDAADEGSSAEPLEEQPEPKVITESYVLTVNADVARLTRHELNALFAKEHDMINTDLREKRMADLRNLVEEYVYNVRGKLSNEMADFVPEDNKSKIFDILEKTEVWIYECENLREADYRQRLDELKELFEPLMRRYLQFQDINIALTEFQKMLHVYNETIKDLSQEGKFAENNDLETIRNYYEEAFEYFNQCLSHINRFNKWKEFPVTADAIRKEMRNLEEKVDSIIKKNDAAMPEQEEKTSASGDVSEEQKHTSDSTVNEDSPECNFTEEKNATS